MLLGSLLCVPGSVHAQEVPDESESIRVVTIAIAGAPLHQALDLLAREANVPIFFESGLVADRRSTCMAESLPVPEALTCVLQGTGLDWIQLSRGTYVVVSSRSEAPEGGISGWIQDAATGKGIPHAQIEIPGQTSATATDEGYFHVSGLQAGPAHLIVTHVGFSSDSIQINIQPFRSEQIRIPLQEQVLSMGTVVINGLESALPQNEAGTVALYDGHIRTHPTSAWSMIDPITQLPGTAASPALGDLHLQGSSSGSHEYRLDGAPVYMPIKNGAFISPFSSLAIDRITLYKAGFPARVGSQLAGFVELDQHSGKDGHGDVALQVDRLAMNARLTHRWTLQEQSSVGVMLAGRKSLGSSWRPNPLAQRFSSWSRPDVFLSEQLGLNDLSGTDPYRPVEIDFTDMHGRIDVQWKSLRRLSLSSYYGFNVFGSDLFEEVGGEAASSRDEYQWKNRVTTLRYSWVMDSGTFVKIEAWNSDYRLEHPFVTNPFLQGGNEPASQEFNEIDQNGARLSVDRAVGHRSFLSASAGLRVSDSDFRVSSRPFLEEPDLTAAALLPSRWLLDGFVEWRLDLGHSKSLTSGTRIAHVPSHGRPYLEPRLTWRHAPARMSAWKGAYRMSAGVYRQFTTQLDLAPFTESALLPGFRLWIPIGQDAIPAWALHTSTDVVLYPLARLKVSLEAFAKYAPRTWLLDYSRTATSPLARAETSAAGASIDIRWHGRRFEGGGSYAHEHSEFKQNDRFGGQWMTNPWSMPHRIQLSGAVQIGRHVKLDVSTISVLGRTWGYRMSYYNYLPLIASSEDIEALSLDRPDRHRPGAFHRVDLGLGSDMSISSLDIHFHTSILNVFDASNVVDWMLPGVSENGDESAASHRLDRLAMPRLLLVSMTVTF